MAMCLCTCIVCVCSVSNLHPICVVFINAFNTLVTSYMYVHVSSESESHCLYVIEAFTKLMKALKCNPLALL